MLKSDPQVYLPAAYGLFGQDRNWHPFIFNLFKDFWTVRCAACHHHPTPLFTKVGPLTYLIYPQILQTTIDVVRFG
jgi:hypothetical protein